jgi:hypothetical protein
MSLDIEVDFQRELALLEAASMGWTLLEPGVYLHVGDTNATEVLVVGVPEAGAAVLLVRRCCWCGGVAGGVRLCEVCSDRNKKSPHGVRLASLSG